MAPFIPDEAINFEPEQHKVVIDSAYRPDRQVEVLGGGKDVKVIKPTHRN